LLVCSQALGSVRKRWVRSLGTCSQAGPPPEFLPPRFGPDAEAPGGRALRAPFTIGPRGKTAGPFGRALRAPFTARSLSFTDGGRAFPDRRGHERVGTFTLVFEVRRNSKPTAVRGLERNPWSIKSVAPTPTFIPLALRRDPLIRSRPKSSSLRRRVTPAVLRRPKNLPLTSAAVVAMVTTQVRSATTRFNAPRPSPVLPSALSRNISSGGM